MTRFGVMQHLKQHHLLRQGRLHRGTGKVLESNRPRRPVIRFGAQWDECVRPDRPQRAKTEIFQWARHAGWSSRRAI